VDTRPRNAVVSCFNRHEKHLVIPQIEALDVHTTSVHGPCSREHGCPKSRPCSRAVDTAREHESQK